MHAGRSFFRRSHSAGETLTCLTQEITLVSWYKTVWTMAGDQVSGQISMVWQRLLFSDFQKGSILLYWSISHRDLWLYISHWRAKKYFLTVYMNTRWIWGAYLPFWPVVIRHPGHRNRAKFILCFMCFGAWKIGNSSHASGSSRGCSGKAGVSDVCQPPGGSARRQIYKVVGKDVMSLVLDMHTLLNT